MFRLDDMQHDALVEIFNQGVGLAAAAVSEIVNDEVAMSFPSIVFETRAEAALSVGGATQRRICAITQRFTGSFGTTAMLMFPEEKSLELVRLMVGGECPAVELTELEQEAMSEIGNIVLNCCVGRLANAIGQELSGSLPQYCTNSGMHILDLLGGEPEDMVLTLKIDFSVESHRIDGYLALLLDGDALSSLAVLLDRYLSQHGEF
ncbi:chemotaxis protein CheC [Pseudoduganella sp. OTU4001]|uniref:chemotaxis protein CheC n=1 Tax=Pseudoduganella sp. OTU4001 TaxID=3043854 RepID=UPI00313CDB5B